MRFLVVEQDIPPVMRGDLMLTLRARLDLGPDGDKVVFFRCGGESDLRPWKSGHTLIRAGQFAKGGWQPPPEIISRRERMADSHCAQISCRHQSRRFITRPTSDAQDFRAPTSRSHNRFESVKRFCFKKSTCQVAQKTKESQWHTRKSDSGHSSWRRNGTRQCVENSAMAGTFSLSHVRGNGCFLRHPDVGVTGGSKESSRTSPTFPRHSGRGRSHFPVAR